MIYGRHPVQKSFNSKNHDNNHKLVDCCLFLVFSPAILIAIDCCNCLLSRTSLRSISSIGCNHASFLACDLCDHLLARTSWRLIASINGSDCTSFLACDHCNRLLSRTSSQLFAPANIITVNLIDRLLQSCELFACNWCFRSWSRKSLWLNLLIVAFVWTPLQSNSLPFVVTIMSGIIHCANIIAVELPVCNCLCNQSNRLRSSSQPNLRGHATITTTKLVC